MRTRAGELVYHGGRSGRWRLGKSLERFDRSELGRRLCNEAIILTWKKARFSVLFFEEVDWGHSKQLVIAKLMKNNCRL